MVTSDLPTPEQFEEAQEADDLQEIKPFWGFTHVDEFETYTQFMAYAAAEKANSASETAYQNRRSLDGYEDAAKGLLLGIGAAALIEAVIGDARL